LQSRYRGATFDDRIRILDEFVALTGYHRKHSIRLLRAQPGETKEIRERNRLYDEAVRQALTVLWEAADRVCGKRLKALIPKLVDAMERHGHLDLDPVIKAKLLQVSAATIDRLLANARLHIDEAAIHAEIAREHTANRAVIVEQRFLRRKSRIDLDTKALGLLTQPPAQVAERDDIVAFVMAHRTRFDRPFIRGFDRTAWAVRSNSVRAPAKHSGMRSAHIR